MNRTSHQRLKRLAPVTALVFAATGLSCATLATAGNAAADEPKATLKLLAPNGKRTIERYQGEPALLQGLGLYAVAEKAALEINTRRASYHDPITASLTLGSGSTKKTSQLPTGLVTSIGTLNKFFTVTVKDKAGTVVDTKDIDFCPNSYQAARSTPTGESTSPYPSECGDHPFALGHVLGIQRGWSVPATGGRWEYRTAVANSFEAPDGDYDVNLQVRGPWRQALGLSTEQSQVTTPVTVTTVSEEESGKAGRSAAKSVAGHQHSGSGMAGMTGMAADGSLSPQFAELEAARKRTLGHARTPAAGPPSTTTLNQLKKLTRSTAGSTADNLPKPDLRSLPAYQIALDKTDGEGNPTDKTYLNFGATVWNAGPSPLVVDGFRRSGDDLMDAYQYFYDSKGKEVGAASAGTMEWDPRAGHEHWHFTAFATYRLLDETKKITERSGKEAFCLVPTDAVDLHVKNAEWKPASTDLETACGDQDALSIREVLDVGWGDTYGQYLPGQSFDVTDLKSGVYYIEVLANPDHKLAESNTNNNQALRKVELGGEVGGERTLKVLPYEDVDAP
jgi:lysyl oxidase